MKKYFKYLFYKIPAVRKMRASIDQLESDTALFSYNSCFPPGHYYSPIVNVDEVKTRANEIWKEPAPDQIEGIDLNADNQLALLDAFSSYYKALPFQADVSAKLRYYFENDFYSYTDGITLYSILRQFKPARVIEAGSGFSSALMLDVKQLFPELKTAFTFIEPYPERLNSLLKDEDRQHVLLLEKGIQQVELSYFEQLAENDILFIDSTHVSKTGSDVNYIIFEILPRLKSGVIIHIHDIFYPFEYPKNWVLQGRNWNETYLLHAFLMYNKNFEILFFADYLHQKHSAAFSTLPLFYKNTGGCLWLKKL